MQVARGLSRLRSETGALAFGLFGAATVVMALAATNCGGSEPDDMAETVVVAPSPTREAPTPTSVPVSEEVELPIGATLVLESVDGKPVVEGSFVELEIGEEWASGFDGCNGYGGRIPEGGAIFGAEGAFAAPPMASTARLCSEPEGVMEQADAFMAALMAGDRYRVMGERLEILDGDGIVRLVFVKQVPLVGTAAELSGTSWRQVTEVGDARPATMVFLDDRLVIGDTACRPYLATYSATEDGVRFPSKSMLQRGRSSSCSDEKRMLEGEFGDFFTWAREYAVQEQGGSSRLTMRSSEGETLYFDPLPVSYEDVANAEWNLVAFVEVSPDEFGMWRTREGLAVKGADLTMTFGGAGVSGSTGCNSYGADAIMGDGSIAVSADTLSWTERWCEEPERVMEQEERFLDLLPGFTRFEVFGDYLVLWVDRDVFALFRAGSEN